METLIKKRLVSNSPPFSHLSSFSLRVQDLFFFIQRYTDVKCDKKTLKKSINDKKFTESIYIYMMMTLPHQRKGLIF